MKPILFIFLALALPLRAGSFSTRIPHGPEVGVDISADGETGRIFIRPPGYRRRITVLRGMITALSFPDEKIRSALPEDIDWIGHSSEQYFEVALYPEGSIDEYYYLVLPEQKIFGFRLEEGMVTQAAPVNYAGPEKYFLVSLGNITQLNGPGQTYLINATRNEYKLIDDWAHPVESAESFTVTSQGELHLRGLTELIPLDHYDEIREVKPWLPHFALPDWTPGGPDLNFITHHLWDATGELGLDDFIAEERIDQTGFRFYSEILLQYEGLLRKETESQSVAAAMTGIRLILGGESVVRRLSERPEGELRVFDYLKASERARRPEIRVARKDAERSRKLFATRLGKLIRSIPDRKQRFSALAKLISHQTRKRDRQMAIRILRALVGNDTVIYRRLGISPDQTLTELDYAAFAKEVATTRQAGEDLARVEETLEKLVSEGQNRWGLFVKILTQGKNPRWQAAAIELLQGHLRNRAAFINPKEEDDVSLLLELARDMAKATQVRGAKVKCPLWLLGK